MNYLIAGAGYTGLRVARRLPAAHTWVTRRAADDDERAHTVAVDFDATPLRLNTPPPPWALLYTVPPRQDAEGEPRLAAFLDAITDPPERIVYLSTSGVYGDRQGALTPETAPLNAQTARAGRRQAAEALLTAWSVEHGAALVILRVPGIYGPNRLGLARIRRGEPVLDAAEASPGNRIHVDDLASACLAALAADAPAGTYNVGDGDHRSATAFAEAVAALAGLPPAPEISLDEAKRTWSPVRLSFVLESRRLDTRRARDLLGFAPRYADPEDGIRASLIEEGVTSG